VRPSARVAETGKRVLMLERGDFLPRKRDNWNSQAVFGDAKYTADETFYDLHDRPFRPELHYYVGGNSKVYGGALFRLLPSDFGQVQHSEGITPARPLSYQDMEPYHVRAEHLFCVHGKHGEDPFAGFSSRDCKYPPVQHEPRIQQLSDDSCIRFTCRWQCSLRKTPTAGRPRTHGAYGVTAFTASPA
jgi:choline dehydrogenase-like flavoprotein